MHTHTHHKLLSWVNLYTAFKTQKSKHLTKIPKLGEVIEKSRNWRILLNFFALTWLLSVLQCVTPKMTPSAYRDVLSKPRFHYAIWSASRSQFSRKNEGLPLCKQNRRKPCFPLSLSPGRGRTTWILWNNWRTVETLHCWWSRPRRWRERVKETEVKQDWTDGHSLDGELRCFVEVCSLVEGVFTLNTRTQDSSEPAYSLLAEKATKHAYLLIQPGVLLHCVTEWDRFFFALSISA